MEYIKGNSDFIVKEKLYNSQLQQQQKKLQDTLEELKKYHE